MRLGVLANREHAELPEILENVIQEASALDFEILLSRDVADIGGTATVLEDGLDEVDYLMTLGGDGTLLQGARLAGPKDIPVVGVNLGHLGFLTAAPVERLDEALNRLRSGDYEEERRLALRVEVVYAGAPGDSPPAKRFYALNDAVVHKGGFARLIAMRVWVDEDEVGQYSADGIVLATATGSTAYSLSAGGPILVPSLDALIATPICPHTLAVRPVVVPADSRITVEILSSMDGILVTVDGQTGAELGSGDTVRVRRSPHPVRLIRFPDRSFFSVLRQKLRWGDVRPSGL